jgi:hypothetical protein
MSSSCLVQLMAVCALLVLALGGVLYWASRLRREGFEDTQRAVDAEALPGRISRVFLRVLDRVPTEEELDGLAKLYADKPFSEEDLAARLQKSTEYYHASKLQTNLVEGDLLARKTDREIGLLVQQTYRGVFGVYPSYETEAYLKERYREMRFDDDRFARYVAGLAELMQDREAVGEDGEDGGREAAGDGGEEDDEGAASDAAEGGAEGETSCDGSRPPAAAGSLYVNADDQGRMAPQFAWAVPMARAPVCAAMAAPGDADEPPAMEKEQWRLPGAPV